MEKLILHLPYKLVVLASGTIDIVRTERTRVVEHQVFEQGGAARDREIGPAERVLGKVVAGIEVEALEQGDLLGAGDSVLAADHLHL